jgi:glycosyltransferase involved in cell wall biosynthesis
MPELENASLEIRVSALVPAFNVENYIEECLDSITGQSITPDEVIIIDDGSDDKTLKLVESWANKTAIPTRVISQTNQGITKTRNRLLENASYELIAFLDSDDYWIKSHIEEMKNSFIHEPNLVCCFADATSFSESGIIIDSYLSRSNLDTLEYEQAQTLKILRERITESLIPGCFIHLNSAMFRRSMACEIGLFDESLPLSEDRDFFIRFSKYGEWGYYPKVHSYVRKHDSNSTGKKNRLSVLEMSVEVAEKIAQSENLLTTESEHNEAKRVLSKSLFNYRYSASKVGLRSYLRARKVHKFSNKLSWLLDFKSWIRALISSLSADGKNRSK